MLSLPGARWVQNNGDEEDRRLWTDERYQQQAIQFWIDLASEIRDDPVIVAYNPLNEPHPARATGAPELGDPGYDEWMEAGRGGTADLNRFYQRLVAAIREVDPDTPIMVDGYDFASPRGLSYLEPIDDEAVLYAFHFYEPWQYTTRRVNAGRYAYPNRMAAEWGAAGVPWTIDDLAGLMQPAYTWADHHGISPRRIVCAEFGCSRHVTGAASYLADVISTLDAHNTHWAFYSFREDTWDGMNYELGPDPALWDLIEHEFQ